jgi:hypothetical protein
MATFVPAERCAQLTVNGEQVGIPCQFGLGIQFPTEPTLTDLDDVLLVIGDWITTSLVPLMNGSAHITSMKLQVLTTADGLVKDIELDETGSGTGEQLPSQVAVCMTKDTGYAGRSRRGRLYVWGVDGDNINTVRTLSLEGMGQYNTAFDDLLTALIPTTWVPVVISTIADGAPRVTALATPIFQIVCRDARLDTQRRRLGRSI